MPRVDPWLTSTVYLSPGKVDPESGFQVIHFTSDLQLNRPRPASSMAPNADLMSAVYSHVRG